MGAEWVPKSWEIFNLTTANAILMKLTTILYLHNSFNLGFNLGIFETTLKVLTNLMHYFALLHW